MKILKYVIFLSILSGIFFVVYHQSNKKGFGRVLMSLRMAAVIAAILAGLIPASTEAIEPFVNNNQVVHEKVIGDRELNLLEQNDQQVILAKSENNPISPPTNRGPSNFPTQPSANRPSRPATGTNPHIYRTPPKFDDQYSVPKKEQLQESKTFDYDYRSNDPKKKKQSAEQCELDENVKDAKIEIVYKIKENPALVREAERMGKDLVAQKDVNHLIEQLSLGNQNPGIGNQRIKGLKNVSEARGRSGGRVYFREKDGKIEILAKSNKDNQNKVIGILQKMGY